VRKRDPFGAVLAVLRAQIRDGAFPAGSPLLVADLASQLGVSQTPVREVLAYLAGEGLIDGRQGQVRGYQIWRTEPATLSDLLRLHQAQVFLALSGATFSGPPDPWRSDLPKDAPHLADLAETIFGRWIEQGAAGPLRRAHRLSADRLRLMRLQEGAVLEGVDQELQALAAAPSGTEAAAQVRAYHRRRLGAVVRLSALMK
jgi:DNA-binding transcriptional MocR family regulator